MMLRRVKLVAAASLIATLGTTPAYALVYGVKSVTVTNALDSWLQISEIRTFNESGINVSLSSNGGVATNIGGVWSGIGPEFVEQGFSSGPDKVNNGTTIPYWGWGDVFFPAIEHGTSLTITFNSEYDLSSFSILGRSDAAQNLNVFNIFLLDSSGSIIHSFFVDAISASTAGGFTTVTFVEDINPPVSGGPTVSGVPEPATWAMMITGFGLAGAAARRRRMALTAA